MKSENMETPQVFLVTNVPFWHDKRGSSERIQSLTQHLTSYCDVTVCFIGQLSVNHWNDGRRILACELIGPGMPGRIASSVARQVSKYFKQPATEQLPNLIEPVQPLSLQDFHSDVISNYVVQEVRQRRPHVVLLEYLTLSYLCDIIRAQPDPPLLLMDTHDLMHARTESFASLGLDHWLTINSSEEIAALEKSDVVMAIQEQDAKWLAESLPNRKICIVKHAIKASDLETANSELNSKTPFVIGFVGSAGVANRESLAAFLQNCWPAIRSQAEGDLVLKIGGRLAAADFPATVNCDGVEFSGPFDQPESFYQTIDIAINPAVIASGLKIKSLQALAFSVPLVTNEAGIAGLENSQDKCALLAKDWEQFSQHVLTFANDRDLVAKFSRNCRPFVDTEFAADIIYADLKQIVLNSRNRWA